MHRITFLNSNFHKERISSNIRARVLINVAIMQCAPAASIWFEVWGVVNPVAEIFDSYRKISYFSENFPDFPGKNYDHLFLVVNSKNCLFSLNINIFHLFHLHSELLLLYFLYKTRKRPFLMYFLCKIAYSVFRDPFTTPWNPHDPQA